ncbi:MAG: HutP family protein [Acidaminobacteraceae bacterium]
MTNQSIEVAKAAVKLAMATREEEVELKKIYMEKGYKTVAVDVGGKLPDITTKILERALVASKKNGIIEDVHLHDGAVAGATREALAQIAIKTYGLSAGGKIGIARKGEHISVAIFMSIGLLHLNDIVLGLGHRSLPELEK